MKRVQNLELLEKFSHLYRDYKILPFGNDNINFEDFKKDYQSYKDKTGPFKVYN